MELPTVRVNRELKAFKKKKRAEMLLKQESEIAESGRPLPVHPACHHIKHRGAQGKKQDYKNHLPPPMFPTLQKTVDNSRGILRAGEPEEGVVSVQDEADITLTVSASINHIKNSLCVLTVHILDVLAGRPAHLLFISVELPI